MRSFSPRLVLSKELHPLFAEQIAEVRATPGFYQAIRLHADATRISGSYGADAATYAKHIGDAGNQLIELVALYQHLLKERSNIGVGATLGRLQKTAFIHGFASPRRVTMYVKRLVQIGRLGYSEEAGDRRVRRLIPGEDLVMAAFRNTQHSVRAADLIWQSQLGERLQSDTNFFDMLFVAKYQRYVAGADPLRPFSDVRHFTSKDAGSYLLGSLIYGALENAERLSPETEFTLGYSDASAASGVSRTHVRNVIETAEKLGLVIRIGEGGRAMRLTERMIDSYERCFACAMILVRAAANDVEAQEVQEPVRPNSDS
ncbi:MAG: hypothetical protein R3D51_12060 [Hyphomicrobiaceae bacterium]